MGLDVGTVRFDYLKTPKGTILDFLEFLADNSDEADWHLGAYHNVIVEYESANLLAQVAAFANEKAVSPGAKAKVLAWVSQLPWKDGVITLHLDISLPPYVVCAKIA